MGNSNAKLSKTATHVRKAIGPRRVGGIYYTAYCGKEYRVLGLDTDDAARRHITWSDWAITVTDVDGPHAGVPRTHCTAWDSRDRVAQQPNEA
jgi:hypothetical protein